MLYSSSISRISISSCWCSAFLTISLTIWYGFLIQENTVVKGFSSIAEILLNPQLLRYIFITSDLICRDYCWLFLHEQSFGHTLCIYTSASLLYNHLSLSYCKHKIYNSLLPLVLTVTFTCSHYNQFYITLSFLEHFLL